MQKILTESSVDAITMPENVRVGLMIAAHRKMCKNRKCGFHYHALAFGQSPLVPPETMIRSLAKHADKNHYASAEGIPELREAIAGFNKRHFGINVSADDIFVGPGTKGIIYLILTIIQGDVIIPSPAWIGYHPIAKLVRKKSHIFHTEAKDNYKITAKKLDALLKSLGKKQHLLILNSPNNPTGVVYTKKELTEIAKVCSKHKTFILSDEIYALTTYNIRNFTSLGKIYPEGTFTLNGLAKDRSAGGYRIGYTIFPRCCSKKLRIDFKKVAATVYTNVSTPHQYASVDAYKPNKEIEDYFKTARKLHQLMGEWLSSEFAKIKELKVTKPAGGFYFFVDFNGLKKDLKRKGIKNSNQLSETLLNHPYHFAMVTGDACLLKPDNFAGRIAFVDYDGKTVHKKFRKNPPKTKEEKIKFIHKNAPNMVSAINVLKRFVEWVKS